MSADIEKQAENILHENEWQVIPNPYYTDPNTNKPREKDIVAIKTQFPRNDILSYKVRLFIECKSFLKTTEIYARNADGIENSLFTVRVPFANIKEIEKGRQTHFYEYAEIFGPKDSEDYLYKAINQNLQSFSAFRRSNREKGLYYLLVVYDGELVGVNQLGDRQKYDNALIQIRSLDNTFNLPRQKCLIEAISISKLNEILVKIEKDIARVNSSVGLYHYYYLQSGIEANRQNNINPV